MVITGQPKNTSEYIQASSRVGRGIQVWVGFTLYNQSRSRDRSHFENFKTFHQSLYRFVEPSSVTPLSPKTRERCLPALIVGIARHIHNLKSPNDLNEEIREKYSSRLLNILINFLTQTKNKLLMKLKKFLKRGKII